MDSPSKDILREIEASDFARQVLDYYISTSLKQKKIDPSHNFAHNHDVARKAIDDAVKNGKILDRYDLQRIYAAGLFHDPWMPIQEINDKFKDKSIGEIIQGKHPLSEHVMFADSREALKDDRILSIGLFEKKYLWLIPGIRTSMLEKALVRKFNSLPEHRRKDLMPKIEEKLRSQEIQKQKELGRDKKELEKIARDAVKSRIRRTKEKLRKLKEIHPELAKKYPEVFKKGGAELLVELPKTNKVKR